MPDNIEIKVPDIGDFKDVEVIEVLVKPGDQIKQEDSLITLESDKATMDIPAPQAGTVSELRVKAGNKVSEGSLILLLEPAGENDKQPAESDSQPRSQKSTAVEPAVRTEEAAQYEPKTQQTTDMDSDAAAEPVTPAPPPTLPSGAATVDADRSHKAHASPAVRRFARELGVDLGLVRGSGRKGRITKDDVKSFTKAVMSGNRVFGNTGGFALPEIPPVDFSKFGPTESKPLSRVRKLASQHLQRCWLTVPQVTQFDEADITDLEEFRHSKLKEAEKHDVRLTLVSFLLKAVVVALEKYPEFNASLNANGEELILKQYYHIGLAVNTDDGLVVPVVRDVDKKGLFELAREIRELSDRARNGQIKKDHIEGGCFTISSLGGIGGSFFTPIVNTPEVAILGVSRAVMKPIYKDGKFAPRLILPFALSYDHRVIDGVAGARFTQYLSTVLTDIRHILL